MAPVALAQRDCVSRAPIAVLPSLKIRAVAPAYDGRGVGAGWRIHQLARRLADQIRLQTRIHRGDDLAESSVNATRIQNGLTGSR